MRGDLLVAALRNLEGGEPGGQDEEYRVLSNFA